MAQAGHRSVVPVDVFEAYCRHVAVTTRWTPGPGARRCARSSQDRTRSSCAPRTPRWWPDTWSCAQVKNAGPPRPAAGRRGQGQLLGRAGPGDPERMVVIGAGLTAAHLVANALTVGRRVAWVFREPRGALPVCRHQRDVLPTRGPEPVRGSTWSDRAALMRQQRRASIMFEFRPLLRRAESSGQLTVHRGSALPA